MVLRIFKMIATSGFVTALECTKFVFAGGAYIASPAPSCLRGLFLRQERREKGKGRERKGGKRKGGTAPLSQIPGSAPEYSTHTPIHKE